MVLSFLYILVAAVVPSRCYLPTDGQYCIIYISSFWLTYCTEQIDVYVGVVYIVVYILSLSPPFLFFACLPACFS